MPALYYGDRFTRSTKKLPLKQKEKLAKLLVLLRQNPFDAKLHTKHLTGKLAGLYSLRITRDWRVIFKFLSPSDIQLIDVANRKDIYTRP
jgi:addiction module RelE/StbE family toxin